MKKKNIYLLPFLILVCVFIYSCSGSDSGTNPKSIRTGTYDYVFRDSLTNRILITGVMDIDTSGADIYGHYSVTTVADSSFTGYGSVQRGGEFKGHYDKTTGEISMNMNPRVADANMFINAKVKTKTLNGSWNFSGMRAPSPGGIF